jgi:general secretion pathway protein D
MKIPKMPRWIAGCALAAALVLGGMTAPTAAEPVTLNFVNAEIDAVAKAISQMTGRNFLLDPRVKGTINIVSAGPVPRDEVYSVFLSALRLHGLAAVESRGVTKIVPEADAKQNAGPVIEAGSRTPGDQVVTMVYPLQFESAAQILPVLRPLIPANNAISALAGSNTLVITDYADNAKRIRKIIEALDRPDAGSVTVLPLRHASVLDLAPVISKLLPEQPAGAAPAPQQRLLIAPDVRTNSLLVRSDNPTQVARIRVLVESLDTPARSAAAVRVVYLRNADATRLAETLRSIVAGESRPVSNAPAPGSGLVPQPSIPAASTAGTFIQADPATNSLIIAAPDALYNSLRVVIDQLDARRAQVHLEALIAEVGSDRAAQFGIQFQSLSSGTDTGSRAFGGTNFSTTPGTNILSIAANPGNVGPGLNVGVIRGRITLPGIGEILNLGVLARALEGDADANILSTPNLLTMDNEEAKIVVGQNIPIITGSYAQATAAGPGAAVNPFQTIERRDVGLTLRVRPQVTEGGTVKLRVFQEVSNVQDTTNPAGIITNRRSIESTVVVEDGEIVVLGGLMQDDVKNAVDKVPVLGDIPGVGQLFRYDSRRRVKTNLMVFLRPVVLRDPAAAGAITRDRYEYIRNEQGTAVVPAHWLLPDVPTPRLPPLSGGAGEVRPQVSR